MNLSKVGWTCIFFALTALPGLQMCFRFAPEIKSHGVERKIVSPTLSPRALWDGTFQGEFEKWLGAHIGFRGIFVRTDNQINLSVFNQFSSNSRFQVVLGKDRYLYGLAYVKSYLHPKRFKHSKIDRVVERLRRIQDDLRTRGKGFLLVISPSKTTLCEEFVPDKYLRRKYPGPSNYERLLPELKKANINILDGVSMLRELKERGVPAFSRGSVHWTFPAACVVASHIMRRFEEQTSEKYPPISCSPQMRRASPISQDMDLAMLGNLWFPGVFSEPLDYPTIRRSKTEHIRKPTMAVVGSSFMWAILHYLDAYRAYSSRNFFYYFRTKYTYPRSPITSIKRARFDFDREMLSHDLVLFEINESVPHSVGFGALERFVEHIEAKLTNAPAAEVAGGQERNRHPA